MPTHFQSYVVVAAVLAVSTQAAAQDASIIAPGAKLEVDS